jgi:hypothetical protein
LTRKGLNNFLKIFIKNINLSYLYMYFNQIFMLENARFDVLRGYQLIYHKGLGDIIFGPKVPIKDGPGPISW